MNFLTILMTGSLERLLHHMLRGLLVIAMVHELGWDNRRAIEWHGHFTFAVPLLLVAGGLWLAWQGAPRKQLQLGSLLSAGGALLGGAGVVAGQEPLMGSGLVAMLVGSGLVRPATELLLAEHACTQTRLMAWLLLFWHGAVGLAAFAAVLIGGTLMERHGLGVTVGAMTILALLQTWLAWRAPSVPIHARVPARDVASVSPWVWMLGAAALALATAGLDVSLSQQFTGLDRMASASSGLSASIGWAGLQAVLPVLAAAVLAAWLWRHPEGKRLPRGSFMAAITLLSVGFVVQVADLHHAPLVAVAGLGIVAETWLGAWLRAGLLASPGPRSRAAALGMAMAAPAFLNGVWSVLAR